MPVNPQIVSRKAVTDLLLKLERVTIDTDVC